MAAIEPTARLLWEACRPEPEAAAVRRALDGGADLGLAVTAADEHRISPLLWRALGAADALDALGPERAVAQLGRRTPSPWRASCSSRAPSRSPCARSPTPGSSRSSSRARRSPPATPGRACARWRTSTCCSLARTTPARSRRCVASGWRVVRAADGEQYDTVLAHDEVPSLFLELHFGLESASQRVTALDPEKLWAHRQPAEVAGTPAFVLPQNEELVVLAAHAGKPHHGFVRLVWIADLAMIVRAAEADGHPVDWARVRSGRRVHALRDRRRRRPRPGPAGRRRGAAGALPAAHPGLAGRGDGSSSSR